LVLAIGNYMNGNTSRGCAYGFQIDVLKRVFFFGFVFEMRLI